MQVSHPNLFAFLGHIQRATTDYMLDKSRLDNGLSIRRPRRKRLEQNDRRVQTCIKNYDDGVYSRMEFLRAVSHSVAHTDVLQLDNTAASDSDDATAQDDTTPQPPEDDNAETDTCEVCLQQPRSAVALVPCGHSRFCVTCADAVAELDSGCPLCRCPIRMVLRLFN